MKPNHSSIRSAIVAVAAMLVAGGAAQAEELRLLTWGGYARYFRDDKPTTLSLIRRRCYDELFRGWPRLARFEAPGKPTIQVFRRP